MFERFLIKALGLIINDIDEILVAEDFDSVKLDYYYRPIGGTVEFGENSVDTLVREFDEELQAELAEISLATVIENIFTCNGEPGHEIVFLYNCRLVDPKFYQQKEFAIVESNNVNYTARWLALSDCYSDKYRLVPERMIEYLKTRKSIK